MDYYKKAQAQVFLGVIITSLMIPVAVWTYWTDGSLLKIFLYLYAGLFFTIAVGGITLLVFAVYLRMKTISQILDERMSKITSRDLKHFCESDEKVFSTLAQVYQDMMEVCDEMNFCYGIQIMLAFALIFFYTLFGSFTAYVDIAANWRLTNTTISSIGFAVYYNIVLIAVVISCTLLNRQVLKTKQSFFILTSLVAFRPMTFRRN